MTTGLYALLTHAQPFWADLHRVIVEWSIPSGAPASEKVPAIEPLDHDTARAVCAVFLTTLFVTRTVRNFGQDFHKSLNAGKKKVMRNSESICSSREHDKLFTPPTGIDGRRYNAAGKAKTQ